MTNMGSMLRSRLEGEFQHAQVRPVELFFDLVFVFAITQLSHLLLEHLTWLGAVQTALLLLAVWWAWIFTSWVTNWLDPDKAPVRLLLFVLMLAGLVLSASIPKAFVLCHSRSPMCSCKLGDVSSCCGRCKGAVPPTSAISSASPRGSSCPACSGLQAPS
jgi:hypothetical protein